MELMLFMLMFCCYASAIEYIDLINDTESETFINLTLDDYKLIDDLKDIDVKTVIIAELARNGIELTSDVINFLDHPLQSGHFEGDIKLPLDESIGLAAANYSNSAYAAIVKHRKPWTNGTVPYLVSSNYGSTARLIIARAIDHFHKHTCISFVPRSTQTDYLNIRPKLGCGSHNGRMGNAQDVSISAGCVKKTVIIHELMHALGFFHEQARYDRDQYVEIHWNNIRPTAGIIQQFMKQDSSVITVQDTPYDIHSIVHYHEDEFAKNDTLKTITAVNGRSSLSNKHGLTDIDILKVNKLYSCGQLDNKILQPQHVHTSTGNILSRSIKKSAAVTTTTLPITTVDTKINDAGVDDGKLWTNGVIPYIVSVKFGEYARRIIYQSFHDINSTTCLIFTPRTNEVDFMIIRPRLGCSSNIGQKGGPQYVSLDAGCYEKSTIIHQVLHVAGLYDEHNRFDRDEHVTIHWKNITDNTPLVMKRNQSSMLDYLPYDQRSVMHSRSTEYALARGLITMTARHGGAPGNEHGINAGDIAKVNMLYGCRNTRSTTYSVMTTVRTPTTVYPKYTCLRFIPRTTDIDFVKIKPGMGCSSHIGRKGGPQILSLSAGCFSDIRMEFQKRNQSVFDNLPYDQHSLMHFGNFNFAKTAGLATIAALNGQALGNDHGMTADDIAKVNMLYGCRGDQGLTTISAPN